MLCSQCGSPAERCERCAGALCDRLLCSELHEVSCAAVSALPAVPIGHTPPKPATKRTKTEQLRDQEQERQQAEQFVLRITQHRIAGRSALLVGDLDTAFQELSTARDLESSLDHLGAVAREVLPRDWEQETDLTPLARALSQANHAKAQEAWKTVLEARPARSVQAEAAEQLAHAAFHHNQPKQGLRLLHAASRLGRHIPTATFIDAYKHIGINPEAAFNLYLSATHLDPHTARANGLRDPLTDTLWTDQDARWWLESPATTTDSPEAEHQHEALSRARDLIRTKRDEGWLRLAEGDLLAGPLGVRTLGRSVRAGAADPADHDTFLKIRMAYETAAELLPEVAWPWYRLAELLAWAGFRAHAEEHLREAERRSLGDRASDRTQRPTLRALVQIGLGTAIELFPNTLRPFPSEPFKPPFSWRLRFRP